MRIVNKVLNFLIVKIYLAVFYFTDRLYFLVLSDEKTPTTLQSFQNWKSSFNTKDTYYLNVDEELSYTPLNFDFGPFNLGTIYRYVGIVRDKLCVSTTLTFNFLCFFTQFFVFN